MKSRLLVGAFLFSSLVFAQDITFVNSDATRYINDKIFCNGNVIIVYCEKVISADEISYDKRTGFVCANGNVSIIDEKQNAYFFDSLSINKDFSSGRGTNVKIIMNDQSRLAADKCTLKNGKYLLENVIYTPCYNCENFGELTWQVKALHVTFDPDDEVNYQDADLELFGFPVLYIPYLSRVSPKVKMKSGFLVPKFSTSSRYGFSILPQYLWAISPSQELILKPIITTKIGHVGWIYYGLRFPGGEFNADTSITGIQSANKADNIDLKKIRSSGYRGHLFSKLQYNINEIWRCGFDIKLTSDRYYLSRFPFFENRNEILESSANLEGFDGRNYTSLKTSVFQNAEKNEYLPRVLPTIEHNYFLNCFSGTLGLNAIFMNLDFNNNRSAQKVILNPFWRKTILLPGGQLLNFCGIISFRGQKISERKKTNYDSFSDFTPQAKLIWKWPFFIYNNDISSIFTPMFGVITAGRRKKLDIFEDSFHEITDLNFLGENRSLSHYNIESGDRVCYGFRLSGYKESNILYQFTVGRSTELTKLPDRPEESGLKYKNSNIVTSLDVYLSNAWTITTKGSYSSHLNQWTKFETGLNFFQEDISGDIMFFKGKQCIHNSFNAYSFVTQKYKGASLNVAYQATRTTKLKFRIVIGNNDNAKHNNDDYKLITHNWDIEYINECISVTFTIERINRRTGDLKPDTRLSLIVHMKSLGF
ncbi:MAG: LPS assembly protein LptD [Holosporaceae bacterium]|jgi:LPS-assembly protein|nr:LPS assembly protein LptD [Holosporaceae bacterium]